MASSHFRLIARPPHTRKKITFAFGIWSLPQDQSSQFKQHKMLRSVALERQPPIKEKEAKSFKGTSGDYKLTPSQRLAEKSSSLRGPWLKKQLDALGLDSTVYMDYLVSFIELSGEELGEDTLRGSLKELLQAATQKEVPSPPHQNKELCLALLFRAQCISCKRPTKISFLVNFIII